MTNTTPHTNHILAAYMRSSDADRADGLAWYDNARTLASVLSPNDIARGAGVIAALSPMTSWPLNVKRATEVFDTGTTKGLTRNVDKAVRIYNGESPLSVLSGDKVRAFYLNIMGVHTVDAVTVDRHAIDVACGNVLSDTERAAAIRGKAGYGKVASMYVEAASVIGGGITPAQLQAVVWVYWRRNVAHAFHGDV